ncbi:hypothetical protein DL96DRAFT_1644071 [Flagelloscypha sp. PMI_526]|nr:hypothetical protein DL96DRAFT_1644071 [Flagelloscypha sp. PMI_526]
MGSSFPSSFPEDIIGLFCLYLPNLALKQCCLTSRTFRHFSRPLLFESLTILNHSNQAQPGDVYLSLWEALKQDPEVGTFVKSVILLHMEESPNSHVIKCFEIGPRLSYILTHLPNLTSFGITQGGTPSPWRSNLSWDTNSSSEIMSVIHHILNLPTLKTFHFTERHDFKNPNDMHQLLRLTKPSGIRSLHLYGFEFLERKDDPCHSLQPAEHQSKIENFRLYYMCHDPVFGLRMIRSFTSPISSFNVTNLFSLELWGIGVQDDTWIPAILDAQRSDAVLQQLGLFLRFIQSLSRFTSIRKLSVSEQSSPIFRYEPLEVNGIISGFAAAWISSLPMNIISTVEELLTGLLGVDEILTRNSSNGLAMTKNIRLQVGETPEAVDVEDFLREKWSSRDGGEDSSHSSDLDKETLRKWVASIVLPKTSLKRKVEVDWSEV